MVDSQEFIEASIDRHRRAIEGDYQQLLNMQRDQYLSQVTPTQMREMEEQHSRKMKELSRKLELQQEATNFQKGRKSKLTEIANRLTFKQTSADTKRLVMVYWRDFIRRKRHIQRMNVYSLNYARRAFARVVVRAWKDGANESFRERSEQLVVETTQMTKEKVIKECSSELNTLRHMVEDLTEDLRKETLAKNALRFKFESAMLRGMNALSIESMTLQQETMERDREFSLISRNLVYSSPDKAQD